MTPRKPQPWYAAFNQHPRSPKHGRHWRPTATPHGDPADRADPDYSYGAGPALGAIRPGAITYTNWTTRTIYFSNPDPIAPAIPHTGIRAGELTGYRMWLVLPKHELCSLAHHFIWQPGATIEGDVDKIVEDGLFYKPIFGGTYSFSTEERMLTELGDSTRQQFPYRFAFEPWPVNPGFASFDILTCLGIAYGTIKMWGEVVEHDHGYRAQFAKLTSLTGAMGLVDINALRRKYNV